MIHGLYKGDCAHLQVAHQFRTNGRMSMDKIYQAGEIVAGFTLQLAWAMKPIDVSIWNMYWTLSHTASAALTPYWKAYAQGSLSRPRRSVWAETRLLPPPRVDDG